MHFKVTISLAFAFKVTILYIFGIKKHFQVTISLAFALTVTILYIFGVKHILKWQFPEHLPAK